LSSRRAFLGLPLGLLAGCGFQPVYGPGRTGSEVPTAAAVGQNEPQLRRALATVRVGQINERTGQIMRRTLQRNLEGLEPGTPGRYNLEVGLSFAAEPLGFRRDGIATRVRFVGTATWLLYTLAVPAVLLNRGTARSLDSFNLPDLQFFAADASLEDSQRRLIVELSDRVVLGVAIALRQRMAAGTA